MGLNIILIALAAIFAFIAIVLFIIGLIKKNKSMWVISLIAFLGFSIFAIYSTYKLAKEGVDYLKSDGFKTVLKESSEEFGESVGSISSGISKGLSTTLDDETIEEIAHKGGTLLGKGIKAISQGLDEGLNTSTVFIDESLNKDGVMIKLARIDDEELNNIALNLLFNDGFSNELTLVAYDNNGNKVESVTKNVIALKGSEKTEAFEFQNRDAIDIAYCILKK